MKELMLVAIVLQELEMKLINNTLHLILDLKTRFAETQRIRCYLRISKIDTQTPT